MNNKRRLWIIIIAGIIITLVVGLLAFRLMLTCCAMPPSTELTANSRLEVNETTVALLNQTQTAALEGTAGTVGFANDYSQPPQMIETQTAAYFVGLTLTQASMPTFTPIPYTADMSPTALPPPSYTPTLCPPSDVICPGGNATMSAADKVMVLMASASAPEFGQLAQTATALAVTPTPTPTSSVRDSNCAFSWAHQDLPEVAQAAQEAFSATNTQIEVLRADAYGENCNRADGSVSYFGAMTTDFYLSANVTNLNDDDELAEIVKVAYETLTALKVKLPAAPGYLDMMFTAQGSSKNFRAMFYELKSAIETGIGGGKSLLEIGGLR